MYVVLLVMNCVVSPLSGIIKNAVGKDIRILCVYPAPFQESTMPVQGINSNNSRTRTVVDGYAAICSVCFKRHGEPRSGVRELGLIPCPPCMAKIQERAKEQKNSCNNKATLIRRMY